MLSARNCHEAPETSLYIERCKYQCHSEWPADVSERRHSVNALVHLLFQQLCIVYILVSCECFKCVHMCKNAKLFGEAVI